jgi:hypothetical protein
VSARAEPAPDDPGGEVDLDAPATGPPTAGPPPTSPPTTSPPTTGIPASRWPGRRALAVAVVALVLGAGWLAQQSTGGPPRPATGTPPPAPTATSSADAARLRHLLAVDSVARSLGSVDPRLLAAQDALADCSRAAATAALPDAGLRACQAQFDATQQQVWDDAHVRALAAVTAAP